MQTNKKKAKHTVPKLLLSVKTKMKLKESAGSDLDTEPCSHFYQSELQPQASKPPQKNGLWGDNRE